MGHDQSGLIGGDHRLRVQSRSLNVPGTRLTCAFTVSSRASRRAAISGSGQAHRAEPQQLRLPRDERGQRGRGRDAGLERDIIRERTMASLAAAQAQGRTGGRPTVMGADKLAAARARRARGESAVKIAKARGVSRALIYRHLAAESG